MKAKMVIWLVVLGFFGGVLLKEATAAGDPLDEWHIRYPGKASAIVFGNGRFVAAGDRQILTSTNGVDWTSRLAPELQRFLAGLTFGNGEFLLGYDGWQGGMSVYSSTDGVHWTLRLVQTNTNGNRYVSGLAAGNGIYLASSKSLSVSTNLVDWTNSITDVDGYIGSLCFANDRFIARIWDTGFAMSEDGWNWELVPGQAYWYLAYANGRYAGFASASNYGVTDPILGISSDGYNWSSRVMEDTNIQSLASAGNTFFLFNSISNGFYTSSDADSWQLRSFGTNVQISGIAYGLHTYVAVGDAILQSAPDTNLPAPATPSLAIQSLPGISITGSIGQRYAIEYSEDLENTNSFRPLTNVLLTSSPYLWVDMSATNQPRRFYRATVAP